MSGASCEVNPLALDGLTHMPGCWLALDWSRLPQLEQLCSVPRVSDTLAGWPELVLMALTEEAEIRRRNQALVLYLPTSHCPEQVTWLSSVSGDGMWAGTKSYITEDVNRGRVKWWDHHNRQPQRPSIPGVSKLLCKGPEYSVKGL